MLTESDHRALTELLGEVWSSIQPNDYTYVVGFNTDTDGSIIRNVNGINRTFTTWQDLGDLKTKIVEMGEWYNFFNSSRDFYIKAIQHDIGYADFTLWLMNPERFPELVVGWWKERKVKG